MGQFLLCNWVLLMITISWPMGKNSGNGNGAMVFIMPVSISKRGKILVIRIGLQMPLVHIVEGIAKSKDFLIDGRTLAHFFETF